MQAEISEEKEVIKASIAQAIGKSKYGSFNKTGLDTALSKNFNRDVTTEETDTGWIYEGKHNKYLIDKEGEIYSIEDRTSLKIGDYVNYTYDDASDYYIVKEASGYKKNNVPTDQTIKQTKYLKWRVLTINKDGSIDLIADLKNLDTSSIGLGNEQGCNFGVFILNDICEKQYSNKTLGINARHFNLKDIDKHLTEDGETTRDNYISHSNTKYGSTRTYTTGYYYPLIYEKEIGVGINSRTVNKTGINRSDKYYTSLTSEILSENQFSTAASGLTITENSYILSNKDYYDNEEAHKLIFTGKNTWIASRFISTYPSSCCYFGLEYISFKKSISGNTFYDSTGRSQGSALSYLCPIVTIKRNQKIKLCSGENSETNMHEIQ